MKEKLREYIFEHWNLIASDCSCNKFVMEIEDLVIDGIIELFKIENRDKKINEILK